MEWGASIAPEFPHTGNATRIEAESSELSRALGARARARALPPLGAGSSASGGAC